MRKKRVAGNQMSLLVFYNALLSTLGKHLGIITPLPYRRSLPASEAALSVTYWVKTNFLCWPKLSINLTVLSTNDQPLSTPQRTILLPCQFHEKNLQGYALEQKVGKMPW